MISDTPSSTRGEMTRKALIGAAMTAFARDGFHAASLRGIAQAAGVNQALIGYHFRNKEGLYLAVFEFIVAHIRERMEPIGDQIETLLRAPEEAPGREARMERYMPALLRLVDGLISLMTTEETDSWVQLILREQQTPTAAFSLYYDGVMRRLISLLAQLVQRIREHDSAANAQLTAVAIVGQVLVFRFVRAGVLRLMQWDGFGEAERAAIRAQIRRSLTAMLAGGE